jgi:hypothetical protein
VGVDPAAVLGVGLGQPAAGDRQGDPRLAHQERRGDVALDVDGAQHEVRGVGALTPAVLALGLRAGALRRAVQHAGGAVLAVHGAAALAGEQPPARLVRAGAVLGALDDVVEQLQAQDRVQRRLVGERALGVGPAADDARA